MTKEVTTRKALKLAVDVHCYVIVGTVDYYLYLLIVVAVDELMGQQFRRLKNVQEREQSLSMN